MQCSGTKGFQGAGQFVGILLGVSEDDGPPCGPVGPDAVCGHGRPLAPVTRQSQVLH